MRAPLLALLLGGVVLAALGQLLFKIGATGRTQALEFVNPAVIGGLACYGFGTALWIAALARAPLTTVYPFTALTFVVVYAAGVLLLGEPWSMRALVGIGLILAGLFLVGVP